MIVLFVAATVAVILIPVFLFSEVTIDASLPGPGTEVRCPWHFHPSWEGPELYDGDEFMYEELDYTVECMDAIERRQTWAILSGIAAFFFGSFALGGWRFQNEKDRRARE